MVSIRVIVMLIIVPLIEESIYIFNTEDTPFVEFYDCIYYNNFNYCRRPSDLISLHRNDLIRQCYHDGIPHSFVSLWSNNISVNTILHKWNSGIEMADEYAHYLTRPIRNDIDNKRYVCQCTNPQSFGKNCEYLLPKDYTFKATVTWEIEIRNQDFWTVSIYSDILCYTTLICDSGLLCLDWRDICDGLQQCMLGYDEENCDKLEFNECDDDEYRCMNGMCIPSEYFLDGEYDCMDVSDEKEIFNDKDCYFDEVSLTCDDRICPPNTWSCGDGQCIFDRLSFQTDELASDECKSHRDQYYMCETHLIVRQWTLPNGMCYIFDDLKPVVIINNRSILDDCEYFVKCALSFGSEDNCPCQQDWSCINELENPCNSTTIQYPKGGIIAPYIIQLYNTTRDWSDSTPDFIILNATIKCRGYIITYFSTLPYPSEFHLNTMENFLCNSTTADSSIEMNTGYDQFCHNDSRTFNNRSYRYIDVCKYSRECISAYRIRDGYPNCVDKMDELIFNTCFQMKQYRFRCSADQPTCLTVNHIGDLSVDCENNQDELSSSIETPLAELNCNYKSKDDCAFIRQYIETSWNTNNDTIIESKSTKSIPFRAYCDTFWDLRSNIDENITMCQTWWVCHKKQWQCHTGQCIDVDMVLNRIWDCADASDEEGIFASKNAMSTHNLKLFSISSIEYNFNIIYLHQPLLTICNFTREFPCVRINVSAYADHLTHNELCISLDKIGDGIIDCMGGLDEKNTLEHCNQVTMLGHNYKCLTSNTCIAYSDICNIRCPNKSDDDIMCFGKEKMVNCSDSKTDFMCLNGQCAKNGWCDSKHDCLHGEDEYLCDYAVDHNRPRNIHYRRKKHYDTSYLIYEFQLPNLFIDKYQSKSVVKTSLPIRKSTISMKDSSDIELLVSSICNRGVGILMYNGTVICFCPPQYYGDKCQFHSDRMTVILQLNFSQSIYEGLNDSTVILKLLVLFLFKNQTIISYEFHVRPAMETTISSKKIDYVFYSRSNNSLHNKRTRYFNRSNIINEHPYSLRIEAYELRTNVKPELIAVWQYSVYFDYLPNFRLVKILRLIKVDRHKNPCLTNPCNGYQKCYQLLNQNSSYVCLCPSNYRDRDCTILDSMCLDGFCSTNALCKPNYRGLLRGNDMPYCICPSNTFGPQCNLKYDQCDSNPCQNNGSCFPTAILNKYFCVCNSFYWGENCQHKKNIVNIFINQTVKHRGAVMQHFSIDQFRHDLLLVNQQSFHNLPDYLQYLPEDVKLAEFVIIRLYFGMEVALYLISTYDTHTAASVNATIRVNEKIRCVNVHTIFKPGDEISPFKYHFLCIKNHSLLCFFDDTYLCICVNNNSRAECFIYDQYLDHCSSCFADSLCLKGNRSQPNDFICICRQCHYGHLCQFSMEEFSFTLDSLIIYDHFNVQLLYLILTIMMFFIGGITNYASFVTFKRPNPRKVGVGNYLFILSLFSQFSLCALLLKMSHILFASISGNIPCKIITYMLSITTRYSYWLTSWITIDRVRFTLFPFSAMLKKPHLAIVISLITLIVIAGMHVHELLFYISLKDSSAKIVCVTTVTQMMSIYNRVNVIIHYMVPFCIQIVSITLLIVFTARSRARTATKHGMFMKQLKQQFKSQKELYLTPGIIVLSGLPQIILSFSFACTELSVWQRHTLLVTYFLSYAPQILGFVLFVLPSTIYSKEFRETKLAKTCLFRQIFSNKQLPTDIKQHAVIAQIPHF